MIAIIDGGYFYKLAAVIGEREPETDEGHKKEVEAAVKGVLKKWLYHKEFTHFIGFLDGKGNYRYNIYPEYKANRIGKPKPPTLEYMQNYLVENFGFVKVEGIEADDAVAITQKKYKELYNDEVYIISADKDLAQIEGKHLHITHNNGLEEKEMNEEISERMLLTQMVTGDSSDNIKGIEGRGKAYFNGIVKSISSFNSDTNEISEPSFNTILSEKIFSEYIIKYGVQEGLRKFSENYLSLYLMREEKRGFRVPEPYKINRKDGQ